MRRHVVRVFAIVLVILLTADRPVAGQTPEPVPTPPAVDPGAEVPAEAAPAEPPPRPLRDWLHDSRLTGDWGGARTALEDAGITFDLYYNHFYGVLLGGGKDLNNAQRNSGTVDWFTRFDLGKMKLLPDGLVLVQTKGSFSRNINPKVGALSDPFDDADGDRTIWVNQAWFQKALLEDKLRLRLGYIDFGVLAERNDVAGNEDTQFMSTYLDNNALVPLKAGWGAALFVDPVEWFGLIVGAVDADAQTAVVGLDTAFHDRGAFIGYLEANFRPRIPSRRGLLSGNWRVGAVYDPNNFPRFGTNTASGHALSDTGQAALYVSIDQPVFRESDQSEQGLSLFFRYGLRDRRHNRLSTFYSGGLQYEGLLPQRDRDVLGFGMYYVDFSEPFRDEGLANRAFTREVGYELDYSIQVTPWLTFTPDVQYIVQPGGSSAARDATIIGFRARVTF